MLRASTDNFSTVYASSSGASSSLSLTGLSASTTMQIRIHSLNINNIQSRDDVGTLLYTTVTSSTMTLQASPGDFQTLTAANVGVSSVTLTWSSNGNSPSTVYQLKYSTSSTFIPATTIDSISSTSTVASSLSPNTSYYFHVRAWYQDNSGLTDYNTTIATYTLPAAPGYTSFRVYTTSAIVYVSTNANPSGTRYQVQVSSNQFSSISFSSISVPVS